MQINANPYLSSFGVGTSAKTDAVKEGKTLEELSEETLAQKQEEQKAEGKKFNQDETDFPSWWKKQQEEEEKPWDLSVPETDKFKVSVGKPKDSSAQLTARLVNAASEMEIAAVTSRASLHIMNLRVIANLGEGADAKKAKAIIRKLEKLIDRAQSKIKSLRNEGGLEQRKKKYEKAKQQKLAEEIKSELRSRRRNRMTEEQRWLREAIANQDRSVGAPVQTGPTQHKLDPATEAEVEAVAQAMAAAEVAADVGTADMTGADVTAGGVEAPAAGAATAAVEGAAEGSSVDISV